MRLISSQRYLDNLLVHEKHKNRDFEVLVSPEFEYDGDTFKVVIDGHHSLAAAKLAGVAPDFVEATCDYIGLCESDPQEFLNIARIDDDYYDVETGNIVW